MFGGQVEIYKHTAAHSVSYGRLTIKNTQILSISFLKIRARTKTMKVREIKISHVDRLYQVWGNSFSPKTHSWTIQNYQLKDYRAIFCQAVLSVQYVNTCKVYTPSLPGTECQLSHRREASVCPVMYPYVSCPYAMNFP